MQNSEQTNTQSNSSLVIFQLTAWLEWSLLACIPNPSFQTCQMIINFMKFVIELMLESNVPAIITRMFCMAYRKIFLNFPLSGGLNYLVMGLSIYYRCFQYVCDTLVGEMSELVTSSQELAHGKVPWKPGITISRCSPQRLWSP